MYALLFLVAICASVGGGILLANKWVSDFGRDSWPMVVGIGILGFLLTLALLGLATTFVFIFAYLMHV